MSGGATEEASFGVSGVTVEFGRTSALRGVSLDVPRGEVTAVVGGDGAGKSTLLNVLNHRILPREGSVRSVPAPRLGYQPATSGVWRTLTVAENLAFVGRSYGMSGAAIAQRSTALLERAGLDAARTRLGRDLSGGMRQKLGFLLAILHDPDLVLLDEPSTGVDPVSRVELWRLIAESAAGGTAVLLATTYLDEAARATNVLALDAGRPIAQGDPEHIVASVPGSIRVVDSGTAASDAGASAVSWRRGTQRHEWIAAGDPAGDGVIRHPDLEDALIALTLAASPPPPPADREGPSGDRGGGDSPPPQSAGDPSPPEAAPTRRSLRGGRSGTGGGGAGLGEVVAAGHGIVRRFGAHTAVDDVTIDVRAGEIVGLIGANGAGKTTFLRTLIGLDRADEGTVELFGRAPDAASRRRLGYVPQGLGLYQTLSVRQNAGFYRRVYDIPEPRLPAGLDAISHDLVASIGLGRQRQLAFALALSHDPELLVLDEPTSGVDPLSRARLWDIIHEQAAAGRGVIVTTHYLQEAEQCTRLALLSGGRLLGSGSVADLTRGTSAVLVRTRDWQRAFATLGAAGLPTMLSGRDIRVAGSDAATIRAALGDLDAAVESVPPTLEETMVLLETPTA